MDYSKINILVDSFGNQHIRLPKTASIDESIFCYFFENCMYSLEAINFFYENLLSKFYSNKYNLDDIAIKEIYELSKNNSIDSRIYEYLEKKDFDYMLDVAEKFGFTPILQLCGQNNKKWFEGKGNVWVGSDGIRLDDFDTNKVLILNNEEVVYIDYSSEKVGYSKLDKKCFLKNLDIWKAFYSKYESGSIPGIIPESKKDEWLIVPKEYVKDEWWEEKQEEGKKDGA